MQQKNEICYLCGKSLENGPINRDHVPPQQFFTEDIRRKFNPSLLTIPVHKICNSQYQKDEDYFVATLVPFARGSYAGDSIFSSAIKRFRKGKKKGLVVKVINEFDIRPSGLVLPNRKIVKRFEGERLKRVAWKIVRGLYYHHFSTFLPPDLLHGLRIVSPGETPPPDFEWIRDNCESHGEYQAVFAYRFKSFPEANNCHYWAMLLWDRLILLLTFHDPKCSCKTCLSKIPLENS